MRWPPGSPPRVRRYRYRPPADGSLPLPNASGDIIRPMDPITLKALADFPAQLEAHYGAIPATHKHWKPASWDGITSEPLSPIEQLCHVGDVEIEGYQLRFQRTLKEESPFLPALDTDGLARNRECHKQDAVRVLAEFRDARAKTLEMLKALSPQQLGRKAEFEG